MISIDPSLSNHSIRCKYKCAANFVEVLADSSMLPSASSNKIFREVAVVELDAVEIGNDEEGSRIVFSCDVIDVIVE